MQDDIFKLFKKSIETVRVKNTPRGTLDNKTPSFTVSLDAIVKRRASMATATADSQDRVTTTSIHFKQEDGEYIKVGHYAEVDGLWYAIETVRDGKENS